jgi:serine/threonine-protein kinase HipA
VTEVDRKLFARRQFLNSYALEELDDHGALRDTNESAQNMLLARGAT